MRQRKFEIINPKIILAYAPTSPLLCRIWSIHSWQLKNLSQLYFLNPQGNDLYVSGLGFSSFFLAIFVCKWHQSSKRKEKASGNEPTSFSFKFQHYGRLNANFMTCIGP